MSKTKTKSSALATLTGVDPRVRMKEVRAMVALAHKQGARIDLMGFKGDDIARSQIAIQDLLSKEQAKHSAARGHIVEQKSIICAVTMMTQIIAESATENLLRDQDKLAHLSNINADMEQECNRLSESWHQTQIALDEALSKLSAAMQTVKTMAEGTNLA